MLPPMVDQRDWVPFAVQYVCNCVIQSLNMSVALARLVIDWATELNMLLTSRKMAP